MLLQTPANFKMEKKEIITGHSISFYAPTRSTSVSLSIALSYTVQILVHFLTQSSGWKAPLWWAHVGKATHLQLQKQLVSNSSCCLSFCLPLLREAAPLQEFYSLLKFQCFASQFSKVLQYYAKSIMVYLFYLWSFLSALKHWSYHEQSNSLSPINDWFPPQIEYTQRTYFLESKYFLI